MSERKAVDLATLIRQYQQSTGDSYSDIARASGLSKAKIGQLALNDSPHVPRTETLKKLAVGLRLPLNVVQHAALVSAGVSLDAEVTPDQRIELILGHLRNLSSADLDSVEIFVRALAARNG